MAKSLVKENKYFLMEMNMKETTKMAYLMDLVYLNIIMEIIMKVNSNVIVDMAKEHFIIKN